MKVILMSSDYKDVIYGQLKRLEMPYFQGVPICVRIISNLTNERSKSNGKQQKR